MRKEFVRNEGSRRVREGELEKEFPISRNGELGHTRLTFLEYLKPNLNDLLVVVLVVQDPERERLDRLLRVGQIEKLFLEILFINHLGRADSIWLDQRLQCIRRRARDDHGRSLLKVGARICRDSPITQHTGQQWKRKQLLRKFNGIQFVGLSFRRWRRTCER